MIALEPPSTNTSFLSFCWAVLRSRNRGHGGMAENNFSLDTFYLLNPREIPLSFPPISNLSFMPTGKNRNHCCTLGEQGKRRTNQPSASEGYCRKHMHRRIPSSYLWHLPKDIFLVNGNEMCQVVCVQKALLFNLDQGCPKTSPGARCGSQPASMWPLASSLHAVNRKAYNSP